jgi:hypothetical protein
MPPRDKRKYCVIKGIAGLGNRLMTLEKGIWYAKATGRTVYVDWRDGMNGPKGTNAFYKYFNLRNVDYTSDDNEVADYLGRGADIYPGFFNLPDFNASMLDMCVYTRPALIKRNKIKIILSLVFRHKFGNLIGLDSWNKRSDPKSTRYGDYIKSYFSMNNFPLGGRLSKRLKEDVVIFADLQPVCVLNNFRNHISLKKEYHDKLQEFALENDLSHAIGIHIRHTDKAPRVQFSKVMERAANMTRSKPSSKIFLSTDNIDIEETFRREFGGRVVVYPKYTPAVSGKGIHHWARCCGDEDIKREVFEGGLADMWLLSMTKYLFRQGNSSFSQISNWLRSDTSRTYDWLTL